MITPEIIKEKALRFYPKILYSIVTNEIVFPLNIPFSHIKPSQTLEKYKQIQKTIQILKENSKDFLGFGYSIEFSIINDRKIGRQIRPEKIYFDSIENYLLFVGKEEECGNFHKDISVIKNAIPELYEWSKNNTMKVIENHGKWNKLLEVVQYFQKNPKPKLYIRELPIEVHTKFVEENSHLLKSLLDFVLDGESVNQNENQFEKRYYLKYDEPLVRLRSLDAPLRIHSNEIYDLSLLESEFAKLNIPHSKVIIVENKTIFLTLPRIPDCIAIFGRGFGVQSLQNAKWLGDKKLFYWGDIDEHGFLILSQIRTYFPSIRSLFMDRETFDRFQDFVVDGSKTNNMVLNNLTHEESVIFYRLVKLNSKNRLEQEHLTHQYIKDNLEQIF